MSRRTFNTKIASSKSYASVKFILLKASFIIVGLLSASYISAFKEDNSGLRYLFFLPLAFSLSCFSMSFSIFDIFKKSFGIQILYLLMTLRYVISPALIKMSGVLVMNLSTSNSGIQFAIFMMILELVAITIALQLMVRNVKNIAVSPNNRLKFRPTWMGVLFVSLLLITILYRGTIDNILEHLSFGFTFNYSSAGLKTYDMLAFLTLKVFLYISVVSWLARLYHNSKSVQAKILSVFLALVFTLLNALIFEADNRTSTLMNILASLFVLVVYFGKHFKRILPVFILLSSLFIFFLFAEGTIGFSRIESSDAFSESIPRISQLAELYSNGISTVAHSYDMYESIRNKVTVGTYISELIKSNNVFTLPGLWVIRDLVDSTPSFQNLFRNTLRTQDAFILPNAGLSIYMVGLPFGLILDVFFHFILIYGIVFFHKKVLITRDISKIYFYTYCEMILAFGIINNVFIVLSLITGLPFLLYMLLKINQLGRFIILKNRNSYIKT